MNSSLFHVDLSLLPFSKTLSWRGKDISEILIPPL